MDFTIDTYKNLLISIMNAGYLIQTFKDLIQKPKEKVIVLRHDVDERPLNALKMATIENEMGIGATYYFRIGKISNRPEIIKRIVSLGHEIGYHYEDFSLNNGSLNRALTSFNENLSYFRQFYPVTTVCMHGSSFSKFDNRKIWDYHSLEEFGLIGEPYLSVDYSKVFYITDTARCWNADKYSIRDKVKNTFNLSFYRTKDIINAIEQNRFPEVAIIQSHTLWTNNLFEWIWLEFRERIRNPLKVILKEIPFLKKAMYILTQKLSNY